MRAWRLTLIVQDSRIYERVVIVVCGCKWGPLLKCRGNLHVEETLEEDVQWWCVWRLVAGRRSGGRSVRASII
jgi:hypothetical protein